MITKLHIETGARNKVIITNCDRTNASSLARVRIVRVSVRGVCARRDRKNVNAPEFPSIRKFDIKQHSADTFKNNLSHL